MSEKIRTRDADAILVIVKDGKVLHYSWNMGLPHVEFVRRTTRNLPHGAWVGTVSKLDGEVMAMSSKHFFSYQLPAPTRCGCSDSRKVRVMERSLLSCLRSKIES